MDFGAPGFAVAEALFCADGEDQALFFEPMDGVVAGHEAESCPVAELTDRIGLSAASEEMDEYGEGHGIQCQSGERKLDGDGNQGDPPFVPP